MNKKRLSYFMVSSYSFFTWAAARPEGEACWIDPIYPGYQKKFSPEVFRNLTSVDGDPSQKGTKAELSAPEVMESLRKKFALGYDSGSPQTEDNRVIAFSPEEGIVVAYTGCPKGTLSKPVPYPEEPYPDCEQIEVMQIQYPSEEIKLTAYRLPGSGKKLQSHPVQFLGQNDPIGNSGARCTDCHGQKPNANWQPYNAWPGFFGSRSRRMMDAIFPGTKEDKLYKAFLSRIQEQPDSYKRYTKLSWDLGRTTDKLKHLFYDPSELGYYKDLNGGKGQLPYPVLHSESTEPNPELNEMFSVWRGRRIIKQLTSPDQYPKIKYALAAIASNCHLLKNPKDGKLIFGDFAQFLPPNFSPKSFQSMEERVAHATEADLEPVIKEVQKNNFAPLGPKPDEAVYRVVGSNGDEEVARLAYLWEGTGNDLTNWNTSQTQKFNFNDGRSATGPVLDAFLQYMRKCEKDTFGDLAQMLKFDPDDGVTFNKDVPEAQRVEICRELAAKGGQQGSKEQRQIASETGIPRKALFPVEAGGSELQHLFPKGSK